MADARASIEKLLSNVSTQPVVFSKSYCPYCKATKGLLSELGYEAVVTELDQVDNGAAMQDELEKQTQQRSVPNIFFPPGFNNEAYPALKNATTKEYFGIKATHVGGNSDIQAAKKVAAEFKSKVGSN